MARIRRGASTPRQAAAAGTNDSSACLMRIAFVAAGGFDRSGRTHVIPVLVSLIERLARRHDVTVYVLRYHQEPCSYPLGGALIVDLGRPEGVVRQHRALVQALKRDGPFDVIHGHWALPAGLAAATAGRRLRVPSVVTFDSGEFVALPDLGYGAYGLQQHPRQRLAVAATWRLATRVTVCTTYMERLARAHGVRPAIVPIGVDPAPFSPANEPDGPPWRLLHVANLNAVKDQATLIEAVRLVHEQIPAVHLDIIGLDTLGGAIQTRMEAMGLGDHVTFHGFQPMDVTATFYRRAHLFVLSSRHEAAGVATLEAAMCGVPTVGTAVGYVADWAPDRAIAVPPEDAPALATAIVALLRDPDRRRRIGDAARTWAVAHDVDWTAGQFEHLYETLAAR